MSVAIRIFGTSPARTRLAITVACTSLGFFVVQLDGSILNIALSQIGISFELRSPTRSGRWTHTSWCLPSCSCLRAPSAIDGVHAVLSYPG